MKKPKVSYSSEINEIIEPDCINQNDEDKENGFEIAEDANLDHFSMTSSKIKSSQYKKEIKEMKDALEGVDQEEQEKNLIKLNDLVSKCEKYTNYLKKKIAKIPQNQLLDKIKPLFEGDLFDYQIDGLQWLASLYEVGANGILGDEMGLGKTIQIIALICYLISEEVNGPFLIVVPNSTLINWDREFEKFAPKISRMMYFAENRATSRQKIIEMRQNFMKHQVIITPFYYPINSHQTFMNIDWDLIVVDEGHSLKGTHSTCRENLSKFNSSHKILLTGTPVMNETNELWVLLNFLMPLLFTSRSSFNAWFKSRFLYNENLKNKIVEKEAQNSILQKFHQVIKPFIFRRTKSMLNDKLKLPPKIEVVVWCPVTKIQAFLYEQEINDKLNEFNLKKLSPFDTDKTNLKDPFSKKVSSVPWIYSNIKDKGQMKHRHIVNHPYLVCVPEDPEIDTSPGFVKFSGKMIVLERLLQKLLKQKHKILIFSQFELMARILMDYLDTKNINFARMTGGMTNLVDRYNEIEKFNDKNCPIFIITTRTGGLGLNLPAADTVIFYDTDWNPQVDIQAQDRCHRFGQTKPVVIYRLLCRSSFDVRMFDTQIGKQRLFKALMNSKLENPDLLEENHDKKYLNTESHLEGVLTPKIGDIVINTVNDYKIDQEFLNKITNRKELFKKHSDNDVVEFDV